MTTDATTKVPTGLTVTPRQLIAGIALSWVALVAIALIEREPGVLLLGVMAWFAPRLFFRHAGPARRRTERETE